jgi:hypothetical protein
MGCLSRSRTLLVLFCTGVMVAGCGAAVSRQVNAAPDSSTSPSTVPASPAQLGPTTQGKRDDCTIPAELEGQDVERLPVEKKVMAPTFDAGANGDGLPSIRATLRRDAWRPGTWSATTR